MLDNIAEIIIDDYELENTSIATDVFTTLSILPANTYYGEEQIIIKNESELVKYFGEPNSTNYKFWWNAWNYLQYGASLNVVRPINSNWENASLKFTTTPAVIPNMTVDMGTVKKAESYLTSYELGASEKFEVFNRFISTNNDIAVAICDNNTSFNLPFTNEKISVISKKDISSVSNNYDQEMLIVKKDSIVISGIEIVGGNCILYITSNSSLPNLATNFQFSIEITDSITTFLNQSFSFSTIDKNTYFANNLYKLTFSDVDSAISVYLNMINPSNTIDVQVDYILNIPSNVIATLTSDPVAYNHNYTFLNNSNNCIYYYGSGVWQELDATKLAVHCKSDNSLSVDGLGTLLSPDTVYYIKGEILKNKVPSPALNFLSVTKAVNLPYKTNALGVLLPSTCYMKTLYGDINSLTNSILDGEVIKYIATTNSFETVAISDNVYYYVESLGLAYKRNSYVWTASSNEYYLNSKNFATLKLYEASLYKTNKSIVTFKDLIQYNPDFTKEFIILVLKKIDDVWYLKEKMLLTYSSYIHPVFQRNLYYFDYIIKNSEYIYLKAQYKSDPIISNLSLADLIITDSTGNDYCDIDYITYYNLLTSLEDTVNNFFSLILGFEYDGVYSLTNNLADNRKNSLNIIGPWNELNYLQYNDDAKNALMISNYGADAFGNSGAGRYTAAYNNMKLQEDKFNNKDIWVPIIGDVAGLITVAVNAGENTPAGINFGEIKNCKKLLYNPKTDHYKDLNISGINAVMLESFSKKFLLFDLLTLEKTTVSIYRDLYVMVTLVALKNSLYNYCYKHLFTKQTSTNLEKVQSDLKDLLGNNNNINKKEINVAYGKDSLRIKLTIEFFGITKKINISIYSYKNYVTIIES